MTTRERFLRTLRFEPVDRPPNFELGYWGQTVERWLQEGMPQEAVESGGFYGHAYFGIERRDFVPLNCGPIPPFEREVMEETERHILYRNEQGILRKALKVGTVRGTRPSMDQYLAFPVQTRADFQRLKKRYDSADPRRLPADWLTRVECDPDRREAPLCLVPNAALGFYSQARRWMGTEGLSLAFYNDPALVHEMMDFIADFTIALADRVLAEVRVDYFNFFEDLAFKSGPLLSPETFRIFLLPRYQRVTEFLRARGVTQIWFDSDGNFEVLIPLLLEAGVTCIWPLEAAAGMDPRSLRREYGRDLALSGGLDKREIAKGKKEIEREIMDKVPALVAKGGYIPTLDHSFPPDISYPNFQYYLEVKRRALA